MKQVFLSLTIENRYITDYINEFVIVKIDKEGILDQTNISEPSL